MLLNYCYISVYAEKSALPFTCYLEIEFFLLQGLIAMAGLFWMRQVSHLLNISILPVRALFILKDEY